MSRRAFVAASAVAVFFFATTSFEAQQSSGTPSLVLSERTDADRINAVARDPDGSVWIVGQGLAGMPTTPDALSRSEAGGGDAFLQRIAPDGSVTYATFLGGSTWDEAYAVTVDASGFLYVAGVTSSTDFPTTTGAPNRQPHNAFLVKLAPGGRSIVYSTYFGGVPTVAPLAIAVDRRGALHVAGAVSGAGFTVTPDAERPTTTDTDAETEDGFYARLAPDGTSLEYATYLGGSDRDVAHGIALDGSDNAYVTGWTQSASFPLKNAIDATFQGSADAFLARFTRTGLDYSTFIGGSVGDYGVGVAVSPTSVYVAGSTQSPDFPGAPRTCEPGWCYSGAFVIRLRLDGGAILATTLLDGSGGDFAQAVTADASDLVSVTGTTYSSDFPVTADAFQPADGGGTPPSSGSPDGPGDVFFATIPMTGASAGRASYSTYLGGTGTDTGMKIAPDGSGGAWLTGHAPAPDFPIVNPKYNGAGPYFVARFTNPQTAPPDGAPDVVLYTRDASSITGNWQQVTDSTAAGGSRIWNPDAGVPKIATAAASPASFFELTFQAQAGVPYHLWLRMKADNDSWTNDSVYVQFSDSVDASGNPVWRIGSASGSMVSLEDCSGCGEHGWGWNDNGYAAPGQPVLFATSGTHTVRIQQREDGVSVDQLVLSNGTYATAAPGPSRDDATILASSGGGTPPPPPDPKEIVMYVAQERLAAGANWIVTADPTAAGGARLFNPNRGAPKPAAAPNAYPDYFDVPFTAEAGVPYHLWVRAKAQDDYYGNDSVFVQFSDSVDAHGGTQFRIGTNSSTNVILEDCSGCGESGWGWQDNAYGAVAAPIYFAKTGVQTIRVVRREDGMSIDQIVLSAGRYLNAAPGQLKNDGTIVPK